MNRANPLYPELRGLVLKTDGVAHELREALATAGPLEVAFIYGSYAQASERSDSDIDLLVVGEVDPGALRRALRAAEETLGREINETVYGPEEFQALRAEEGSFIQRVLAGPTIDLLGSEHVHR